MIRLAIRLSLTVFLLALLLAMPAVGQAQQEPAVRAVLFYSPTCPHCHTVINEVLLPMIEEHGDRLQIVAIDVTQPGGQALYQAAVEQFAIPEERLGVPTLIVADVVLVGSGEIPDQFPNIVREGLTSGIDWPSIPDFIPPAGDADPSASATVTVTSNDAKSSQETATPAPTVEMKETATTEAAFMATVDNSTGGEAQPAPEDDGAPLVLDGAGPEIAFDDAEDPPADPVGFALASVVLIGMVIACAYVVWQIILPAFGVRGAGQIAVSADLSWAIPVLAVVGIGVAAYLAYVEVTHVAAVCGPVGHCNAVQSSPYARLLGIPVALSGLASYLAILALWFVERLAKQDSQKRATRVGLLGLTIFGTLFSIYLTLLELLVIQAVCAWCLTSAVIMSLMMVLVARPAAGKPELAAD